MSSLKEKERAKEQQEKFQAVLSGLLKDEDNKYCVDCDAKGPRWASWNIGVFLCIRCAGIHRNLGVHISKVKSVNLDTWTPEQVAMMQEMGNSRGRAVYEANIPDGFRRPQTDSSLEAFIRSKYEQKKYIAREWIPPQPKVPKEWLDDPRAEKKKAKAKTPTTPLQLTNVPKISNKPGETTPSGDYTKPAQVAKSEIKAPVRTETVSNSASSDLLGLDLGSAHTNSHQAAAPPPPSGGNELLDLFGGPQISDHTASSQFGGTDLMNGATEGNLFEDKGAGGGNTKTSAKDSIMALYGGSSSAAAQPQMYGVPDSSANVNTSNDLMKMADGTYLNTSQKLTQMVGQTVFGQSQPVMQSPIIGQPGATFTSPTQQQIFKSSFSDMASRQQNPGQVPAALPVSSNKIMPTPNLPPSLSITFNQLSGQSFQQQMTPIFGTTSQVPVSSGQFSSPVKQMAGFSNKPSLAMEPQDFGQSLGSLTSWGNYNQAQPTFYGSQGGVYMPQGQQMYQGMMTQQQGMMGVQGMRPQGMMGQSQGMMGQPQGMMGQSQGMGMIGQGIVGQPLGMMGNPQMNVPQMAMYNGQVMAGNPGMYTPQQMQQLQFQQMQQQMTSLKLGGAQMSNVPQQTAGAGGWGTQVQGQTLSTNLWQ